MRILWDIYNISSEYDLTQEINECVYTEQVIQEGMKESLKSIGTKILNALKHVLNLFKKIIQKLINFFKNRKTKSVDHLKDVARYLRT